MLWYHDARMFTGHFPMTGVQIMSTFMSSLQIRNKGKENNLPTKAVRVVLLPVLIISVFQQALKRFMARGGKRMHICGHTRHKI